MNEAFGWCWITLGLLMGGWIGLNFQRAGWLGGYDALPRRMVRLAHIAMVALGALNILFALSRPRIDLSPTMLAAAGGLLVLGAASMPVCCILLAWRPAVTPLFAVPVLSLLAATGLICWGLLT